VGVPKSRIVQAQNCVDERQFSRIPTSVKSLGPPPVLLVVGRLVPGKGVGILLDVAAQLRAEGRRFSLVIVGDGPEREELQRKAGDLGLDNVQFHLTRSPEDLPAYYHGADILVFPTLHDVWGLVVNEALWAGLPVLASKYAGCADEVLPAEQIFDPLDPEDFRAKLRHAIEVGLPPADTSPLLPVQEVADRISDSIDQVVWLRAKSTGPVRAR
jgi:glycosyltransferase involved in cell wall biosynthesis